MREYTILVSSDFKEYWDALISDSYNPTPESKAKLELFDAKNKAYLKEEQRKLQLQFIQEYDDTMYQFVSELMKSEYFLVGKSNPFHITWNLGSDDNDNYWTIRFYKGQFDYILEVCGGYGGTEILESNISKERVKELIFKN